MVRKNEIHAATMNIECLTEVLNRHRRTLNVPAWATWSPGAVPCWLMRLTFFPQGKVHRMAFSRIDIDARAGLQVFEASF